MQKRYAEELIKKAIEREEDANYLYTKAAAMVKRSEVKKFFQELAKEELLHKETLKKIDLGKLEGDAPAKFSDPDLSTMTEVETLSENFSIQEALIFAIKREDEAYNFYKEFADLAEDPSLKNVFDNLASMELRHKTDLEDMYEKRIYQEN